MHLVSQYDDHERNYKPVSDKCFSLILSLVLVFTSYNILFVINPIWGFFPALKDRAITPVFQVRRS